jgi:hypothetical protein
VGPPCFAPRLRAEASESHKLMPYNGRTRRKILPFRGSPAKLTKCISKLYSPASRTHRRFSVRFPALPLSVQTLFGKCEVNNLVHYYTFTFPKCQEFLLFLVYK